VLFIVKTLEDEMVGCYDGLQISCFGDFEKFVCISIYCVSALSLHIESTDSMIPSAPVTDFTPSTWFQPVVHFQL